MALRTFGVKFQRAAQSFYKSLPTHTTARRLQCISIMLPLVYCSDEKIKKIEISSPEELSHQFLLKQASSMTANSAAQLLNQTMAAIIDTAEEYRSVLNELMDMIEEGESNLGNERFQQELSDLLIECRSKVRNVKTQFVELESFLDYVEKVAVAASEATFLVGAEFSSFALSEQLNKVKAEVLRIKKELENLEHAYLRSQQSFIEKTSNHDTNSSHKK